jgi:hypothetical protein
MGLLILLTGGVYRYAPEIPSLLVSDDAIALKMKKLSQQHQLVARQPGYQALHAGAAALLKKAEKGLLKGETPALAAVDLQNSVKTAVSRTGLEVTTFQVMKALEPDASGYIGIPVKFQVLSTVRQLKDVIFGIESSEKLLRIVEIETRTGSRYKPGMPVMVRSIITVEGYVAGD